MFDEWAQLIKGVLYMAVCQNLVPLVNIKIAGKWMFIPLKMVLIGIDPYPYPLGTVPNNGASMCFLSFFLQSSVQTKPP
jgi:hypothetical protein